MAVCVVVGVDVGARLVASASEVGKDEGIHQGLDGAGSQELSVGPGQDDRCVRRAKVL